MKPPKPPNDLGPAGRALWRRMAELFDITGCEHLLGEACRLQDRLALVREEIKAATGGELVRLIGAECKLQQSQHRIWRLLGADKVPAPAKGAKNA